MLSIFPCQKISDTLLFDSKGGVGILQQVHRAISTLPTFCRCSISPVLYLKTVLYSLQFLNNPNHGLIPRQLPHLFFQRFTDTQFKQIQKSLALKCRKEEKILCQVCQHQITSHKNKIEINGQHEHVLSNPCGIVFEIGCFSEAAGCINYGPSTLEHTWFAGYSWRFALCANCLTHLGWFFQSESDGFYGLVLKKLDFGGE